MKRKIIKIDESLCNGCGNCIPNCAEGALQMIDNKARLISDLFCDGLGACIGHCPVGAITIEEREAEPYNEARTMEENIIPAGKNTIMAHLKHLKDHNEMKYLQEAMQVLKEKNIEIDRREIFGEDLKMGHAHGFGGCPGSKMMDFSQEKKSAVSNVGPSGQQGSELRQWPVQLHLVSPLASYFQKADVILAADCVAFSLGNFHSDYLKGKALAIACPKLDNNQDVYVEKLKVMMEESKINTLTVMIMEVPCCGGLIQLSKKALAASGRKVPLKAIVVSIRGEILSEDWI